VTMLGCSITTGVQSRNEVLEELTEDISGEIRTRKYSIDKSLLRKCEWFDVYREGDLVSFEEIHRRNALKARNCYILHNSLVDYIELISKEEE
jgi:hypothetical protein